MPKTFDKLKELEAASHPLSPPNITGIKSKLNKIRDVCSNDRYSNKHYYGKTALNRAIILNETVANNLTPEVLKYIFTAPASSSEEELFISRNDEPGRKILLKDAILGAFQNGVNAICYMPNNEHMYDKSLYEAQKKSFKKHTREIMSNINKALGQEPKDLEQLTTFNPADLPAQYALITDTISTIKKTQDGSAKLLDVVNYSTNSMREQVQGGFSRLLHLLLKDKNISGKSINELCRELTLDELCEGFLKNKNNALLDGSVIHLFYDRAHIEAALEQDNLKFTFKDNKKYTYKDIFQMMVNKVAANPENYPIAVEQFCQRLDLVEADLRTRFSDVMPQRHEEIDTPPPPDRVTAIKSPLSKQKQLMADYLSYLKNKMHRNKLLEPEVKGDRLNPSKEIKLSSKQQKLKKRYSEISTLFERMKSFKEDNPPDSAFKSALEKGLNNCAENATEWKEKNLITQILDILTGGIHRFFINKSKEKQFQTEIRDQIVNKHQP